VIHEVATFLSPVNKDPWKKENVFSLPYKSCMIPSFAIYSYRSKVFAQAHDAISDTRLDKGKGWGLLCSDWREGAVFSALIYGGSRSPEPVEGNAEGAKLPRR
jgi:hypothetical protein